jgi:serine phosphatase RsbU (regulator of sigma subunit)
MQVPKIYLDEFVHELTTLIKSRVKFGIGLLLFTFISGSSLTQLLVYGGISQQMRSAWFLIIVICVVVYILTQRSKTLCAARMSGILLSVMLLLVINRLQIIENVPPFQALVIYLVILFAMAFIIPWTPGYILGLSAIHIFTYSLYVHNVHIYKFKTKLFTMDFTDYIQGVIMLSIASFICFMAAKLETKRQAQIFINTKEIETKNNQMQRELELATKVHKRLVPRSVRTPLADVAVSYLPMHYISGDYAKFHFLEKNKLLFIISDVTGHGVPAALLVNAINSEFERLAKEAKEPGVVLKEMDGFIYDNFSEVNMYLTAFCGLLDFRSKKFTYSSYGHPPQYIYRSASLKLEPVASQTTFLGISMDDKHIYQNQIPFARKDQIFLFTDGATEARNEQKEEYGDRRLRDYIIRNQHLEIEEFNRNLVDELQAFTNKNLRDDIFILNIKVN